MVTLLRTILVLLFFPFATLCQATPAKVTLEEPAHDAPRLTQRQRVLQKKIHDCLQFYATRHLNTRDNSVWSIMHGFIGFGAATQIRIDHPSGRPANAIGWICWNGTCHGLKLFYTENGKLRARVGPGLQGHAGQFLAMLAQCKVKPDYEIRVDQATFTIADLIELEKETCRPNTELTFKLIGLAHYLPSDAVWRDDQGGQWNVPRLIKYELAQPINGVTCGGTHRLMGLSYAVTKRRQREEPLDGQWLEAERFVEKYQKLAFRLQNRNGSFSTKYFRGRENRRDKDRQLETTGHILEWLVFSLPRTQLTQPQVVKAVDFLAEMMVRDRYYDWKVGPRGHAIRALALYDFRVFQQGRGQASWQVAATGQ